MNEIKPKDGFRIVSLEDQKRYEYPKCEVQYYNINRELWFYSYLPLDGWGSGNSIFAVPSSYVFKKDIIRKDIIRSERDTQFRRQVALTWIGTMKNNVDVGFDSRAIAKSAWRMADAFLATENEGQEGEEK